MNLNLSVKAWFAVLFALVLSTGLASVYGFSRMGSRIAVRLDRDCAGQEAIDQPGLMPNSRATTPKTSVSRIPV